jgi:hypothetical protein
MTDQKEMRFIHSAKEMDLARALKKRPVRSMAMAITTSQAQKTMF